MIEIVPNWHPIWVHFVIGLLIGGTLFYTLAWIGRGRARSGSLLAAARWSVSAGFACALLALFTGFLAAGSVPHDDAAHANMLTHRNWALTSALIFSAACAALWIEWRKAAASASTMVLALLLAGSAALAVTGFEGGQNVYEHGLGVRRLPDIGSHDHGAPEHGHHHGEAGRHEDAASGAGQPASPDREDTETEADDHSSGLHIHDDGSAHHH
jgi:uncharacterized membrane protein